MTQGWLEPEQWDALMDGLVRSRFSLLLGAGASVGSNNGLGSPLPIGGQLRKDLIDYYAIPTEDMAELPSLRATYDLCEQISQFEIKEQPAMYLRRKFSGCTVPAWYRNVVRIPWHIIWNLNVDDLLENAYNLEFPDSAVQKLSVTSWDKPKSFHREHASAVSAVHLHGRAKEGNMVFGSLEYLTAVEERGSGHELFKQTWPVNPVVVIGASLNDEIDMNEALLRPRAPKFDDPPSVVVLKSISKFDRFRLDKAGLLSIEATGEEFFNAVHADWDSAMGRLRSEELLKANGIHPAAAYFLQHFREVGKPDRPDPRHDYYSGHKARWSDIEADFDVRRRLKLDPNPFEEYPQDTVRIVAFCGGSLSGKSTAQLRFASDCQAAGLHCYRYDDARAFDSDSLFWYFKRNPTSVLIIDDLVDFRGELNQLIESCQHAGVGARILTTVRDTRLNLLSSIDENILRLVEVSDRLADNEIRSLIQKLEQNHRLNILSGYNDQERFSFFKNEHKASLIAGLEAATRGRGFTERVRENYENAAAADNRKLATTIMLSAEVGYPLQIGTLAAANRSSAASVRFKLQSTELGDLAREDSAGNVRTRQPALAARVFRDNIPESERFDVSLTVARAIAPFINPLTISSRTRYARLGGQLMSARRVMNWLGASKVDDWYLALEDTFEWNARYWEQRALAECSQVAPRYEKAESWARLATSKYEDSYSLNTLAKVLFRRSLMDRREFNQELFETALRVVQEALNQLDRSSEYPYITALTYLTNAVERCESDSVLSSGYRRKFNSWMHEAEDAQAFLYSHISELLKKRK